MDASVSTLFQTIWCHHNLHYFSISFVFHELQLIFSRTVTTLGKMRTLQHTTEHRFTLYCGCELFECGCECEWLNGWIVWKTKACCFALVRFSFGYYSAHRICIPFRRFFFLLSFVFEYMCLYVRLPFEHQLRGKLETKYNFFRRKKKLKQIGKLLSLFDGCEWAMAKKKERQTREPRFVFSMCAVRMFEHHLFELEILVFFFSRPLLLLLPLLHIQCLYDFNALCLNSFFLLHFSHSTIWRLFWF